jgi:hypothetical protein
VKKAVLGDSIPVLSWQWLSFAFGLVSQQHVPPFVSEVPGIVWAYRAGVAAGLATVVLAFAVMARWHVQPVAAAMPRAVVLVSFAALVATICVHLYLARGSLYTQAKGAQNLLVCLYAALVLPFAASWLDARFTRSWLRRALIAALCALAAASLVPRFVFGDHLGRGTDRAAVMESSYFSEASRVLAADPDAFVLFEPRKSADLYLATEPYFGARLMPTRHLLLARIGFGAGLGKPQIMNGSFFVGEGDIAHLWMLGAQRREGRDTWRAEKIGAAPVPMLLLFADDYARDQSLRARPGSRDRAHFSWLRNGSAMVFLPPDGAHVVEATALPANPANLPSMRAELSRRVAAGELPGARLEERAGGIILSYDVPASVQPRLLRIAVYPGEYWLNVRVDGNDTPKSPFAAKDSIRLTARLAQSKDGQRVVRVSWTVDDPDSQDWIGIFPEAGEDDSRIAFKFTGGGKSGDLELPLAVASPGAIEVRFFRAGSWNAVETVRVVLAELGSNVRPGAAQVK